MQEANLSDADLDGADLSNAHLGEHEANRVVLLRTKLSYTTLRGLDLRDFDLTGLDLQGADLNGTDLRNTLLSRTNLQGADLSTAQLHGPELQGAILYRDELLGARGKQNYRSKTTKKPLPQALTRLTQTKSSSSPEAEEKPLRKVLSDQEGVTFGEHVLLVDTDPALIRQLFSQGFTFAYTRHIFNARLAQTETTYTEQEIQAMWIGFSYRMCMLYSLEETP